VLVLDEADRMLDMGFIHDVRRIINAVPRKRQTLLFSATMPPEIQQLANNILINPVSVAVTPVASTVEMIQQSVFFVEKLDKAPLLEDLLRDKNVKRVLVFTRTKHGANKVVKQLANARVIAEAIHGNKSQTARERALANFKSGATRVLVATDIAARGIDVENITHVINYDLPNEPETYVHRIGRTARAGASGFAWSFCDTEEREYLRDIERLIRLHVPVATQNTFASRLPPPPPTNMNPSGRGQRPQPRPAANNGNGSSNGNNPNRTQERQPRAATSTPNGNSNGQPGATTKRRRPRRRKPAQKPMMS
jgi:ATP-dependent RNA helicase RhlE